MNELKSFIVLYDGKFIRAYKESEADKVISELKQRLALAHQTLQLNQPEALYSDLETMARLSHEKDVVAKEAAEQKATANKLHSCLKCLVMRDLIKDCPEKKSAIEIVKEYK